jgi:putative hydrolase of the HAD superfamily
MSFASIAHLEEKHDFWDMFDGMVVSCRIQKVKPDIEIYEHLLTQYQLQATETIFIDDMSENLTAASSIGIQTIRFRNPAQCRQDLLDLNSIQK